MKTQDLIARMASFDAPVLVDGAGPTRYADLVRRIDTWHRLLDREGVAAGEVVAVEGATSLDAIAALLALAARGAVVVPLTRLPAAKREEFHTVAQIERVVRTGTDTLDRPDQVERTGRQAEHALYRALQEAGAPGLVLFSSGTTGRSKATVLDVDRMLRRYGPPQRPTCTMAFLNLDHIGGINTLLHTLSQGGCLVTAEERTADRVCAAIAAHRVQVLPTTPTFLNMLLISGAWERYDLSSLTLVTYGTEPMPIGTLRRLASALPGVRLKQTYGLSELGILPTRSKADDELWVKIGGPGFEYEIREGVLWIRSEMAMLGYLNAPAPFDEQGFFNTQDSVEVDGEYVRILGRTSEIINVAGEKVYPSEVESVLLEHPEVAEATVSGRPSHVTGMVVKATVKPVGRVVGQAQQSSFRRDVQAHCRARLEAFKVPVIVEISEAEHHNDRFKKTRAFT
jgi:acyl-CoA synthetase (AMP-forming)/AMP-acid ligase II